MKIGIDALLEMGIDRNQDNHNFCMTVLGLRFAQYRNGVSQLHKEVTKGMWKTLWKDIPEIDIPIEGITNGVHIPSWVSGEMASLFNRYLGYKWIEDPDSEKIWQNISKIPDAELWRRHEIRRERLVNFVRRRLKSQLERRGASIYEVEVANEILNPDALTIGFARRFATYKRGNLLLKDVERLAKILNDSKRPVQILFAGKAHPHDHAGKELIKNIMHLIRYEPFKRKIVFLENYDMNVGRYLVQGVDIWLNNPRRPLEACGTSGMKVVANGGLNFSVLDGWWDEGYDKNKRLGYRKCRGI